MLEAELPFQHISWCLLLKTHSDRTICKSLLYSAKKKAVEECDCSQNNCSQTINVTICTLYIVVWVRHIVARELMVNEEMWWFVTPDRHTVQTSPQRFYDDNISRYLIVTFAALDSFFNIIWFLPHYMTLVWNIHNKRLHTDGTGLLADVTGGSGNVSTVCGIQVCALLTLARHNYRDGGAGPWFLVPRCEDTSLFWRSCPATAAPPSPRVLYTGANTQVLPFLFLAHSVRHNFLQRTEKEGP